MSSDARLCEDPTCRTDGRTPHIHDRRVLGGTWLPKPEDIAEPQIDGAQLSTAIRDFLSKGSSDGRPSRTKTLMAVAVVVSTRGTCSRAQTGALIVRDGRILATGYNGAPAGLPHCSHPPAEKSEFGTAGEPGCQVAVHAELNAILFAARHGLAVEGAELYTTLSPCAGCARAIINSGIRAVYSLLPYRSQAAMMLLEQAGVETYNGE